MNYSKKYGMGWWKESERHRLARLGVKTGRKVATLGYGIGKISYGNESKLIYRDSELERQGWSTVGGRIEDFDKIFSDKGRKSAYREIKRQYKDLADDVYRGLLVYRKYGTSGYYDDKQKLVYSKEVTQFGVLGKEGKIEKQMTIDISKVKSPDPLAYSYGYFQAKSGQPMSKDPDLAKEYIRGYKDAKAGKKINYAYTPTYVTGDLPGIVTSGLGTAGASAVGWIPPLIALGATTYIVKKVKKMVSKPKKKRKRKSYSKINYMLGAPYPTKKALKESIGKPLGYIETSMLGDEYKENGTFTVVGPDPYRNRKWYATVTMKGGKIQSVK